MELQFETYGKVGEGKFPDFVEFYNTEGQLFFIDGGLLHGTAAGKSNGDFTNPEWMDTNDVTPGGDTGLSNLEVKSLNGFGALGSYNTPDKQVLIIYEYQYDMSKYLNIGSIHHSIDNPISSFTLTLENPIDEETGIEGTIVMSEKSTLLSPGAKVIFKLHMGDDDFDGYELGTFYIDRSNYSLLSNVANVDGRNLIGKALKDQTINNLSNISYNTIYNILSEIMYSANLMKDQFNIQYDTTYRRFEFKPNQLVLDVIGEILKSMIDWKIEETTEGEIIIGKPSYGLFQSRGNYNFKRNSDIFSRTITMDDQESFRKVCVHDREFNIKVYKDVEEFSGWNLQSNKTLFVEVAEGTSTSNAIEIAENLTSRFKGVGKIEKFTGPFRPHLLVGDGATIIDDEGNTKLGLITEIEHQFGKTGYYTNFTVDSGGRLGTGRLSDYIRMINNRSETGSIFYEDIPPED